MPDAPSATNIPPPAKKPRKPSRRQALPPERKKRDTPARTLRRRIDDLGAYCLEAFDRARKRGGEAYEKAVREAMDATDAMTCAKETLADADAGVTAARMTYAKALDRVESTKPVLDRLASDAAALAALDKDHPTPLLAPDGRDEGAET